MHNKRAHWVSLRELEEVAEACLAEGRAPLVSVYQRRHLQHPGSQRAAQFQHGLILKLLVRVPLRQRNVRELRVDKNLYRDQAGHWQLHFSSDELKIGARQGRPNEYTLNLSQDTDGLVPVLEEWLREYRPRLPGAQASPFLFLTQYGRPFTEQALRAELKSPSPCAPASASIPTSFAPSGPPSTSPPPRTSPPQRRCWVTRSPRS